MPDYGSDRMGYVTDIFNDKTISAYGKLVYCALGKFADEDGKCWPSIKTLTECAGISNKTVQKAINELVISGWITKKQRKSNSGDWDSNFYQLSRFAGVGSDIPKVGPDVPNLGNEIPNGRVCGTERVGSDVPTNLSNGTYPFNYTCSFDMFWGEYPKKKAKQDAKKAWDKIAPDDELFKIIMAALNRQRQSGDWTKDGGKFIPYPATWLNGRRWEDEPEQTSHPEKLFDQDRAISFS